MSPWLNGTHSISRRNAKLCVGPGWSKIIDRLYDAKPRNVVVLQIKEKFGSLRYYTGGVPPEFDKLIDEAEAESEVTCEACGEPGSIDWTRGWQSCRCPKCRKEDDEKNSRWLERSS
jgi:hypothetical protein